MNTRHDIDVLRDLAVRYREIGELPIQQQRRDFWRQVNALRGARPAIVVHYGMWNVWCRELFGEQALQCHDPFYRQYEQWLRLQLFQASTGDDSIQEPWITVQASKAGDEGNLWGLQEGSILSDMEGGARKLLAPLADWRDMDKLRVTHHMVDEAATQCNVTRLQEAIGDLLTVNVEYGCAYTNFSGDLSYGLAALRGLEQMMVDMCEAPEELHRLLAFMRDGVLQVQQEAEDAGHFSLTSQTNQAMCYCDGWEAPRANAGARTRRDLWGFFASQEYTLISPEMYDEFCLQYQMPIMEKWGLIAYGCCEDLTRKISLLRRIPNLRRIAVTPVADLVKCAEAIGTDYLYSWHPNPTDVICCGFDEEKIRGIIRDGLRVTQGCHRQIILKDIETVEGEPQRIARWVQLVQDEIATSA